MGMGPSGYKLPFGLCACNSRASRYKIRADGIGGQGGRGQILANQSTLLRQGKGQIMLTILQLSPSPHCVLMKSFARTFCRNQDVIVKLKSELMFIKF